MRVILTDYASQNINTPNVKWFMQNAHVQNILSNTHTLKLCHIKSIKPKIDFTTEYVWDASTEQPIAIFEYGFFENLVKNFKKNRKKKQISTNLDLKILDLKVEICAYLKRFKLFLRSEIVPVLKEFVNLAKDLKLDENFILFFNKNLDDYIYFTFDGLEKSVYLTTISDRLFFIQNNEFHINEFYLIHKTGQKILIKQQNLGNIADEIF